jgi:hypothetical protein
MKLRQKNGRGAFTLVEMLVATALVMFIMLILSEAFVAGLEAFRTLKGIGDMEERLRHAAIVIRGDIQADHFEAGRRISDPNFWRQVNPNPREGFFRISQGNTPTFSPTAIPQPAPGNTVTATITVPSIVGQDWVIQPGSLVLVDQGILQEIVQVQSVTATSFTANFAQQHPVPNPITGVGYYLIRPLEGIDADNIPSTRATEHILHMAVKLRGDRPENFFTAHVPFYSSGLYSPFFPTVPTVNPGPPFTYGPPFVPNPNYAPTMFPDQPADSRYQDLVPTTNPAGYKTQWAEVAYFLALNGDTAEGNPLYALYRVEMKVVPDNRYINGTAYNPRSPGIPFLNGWLGDGYNEMSCQPKFNSTAGGNYYYFNNPTDLATMAHGTLTSPAQINPSFNPQQVTATADNGVNWNIQVGSALIVDSGPLAEMVTVLPPVTTTGNTTQFYAVFGLQHAGGAAGASVFVVNRAFTYPQSPFASPQLFYPAPLVRLRGDITNSVDPKPPDLWSATLLATDVVSFDVRILPNKAGFGSDFSDVVPVPGWPYGTYDTALPPPPAPLDRPYSIQAVQIVLRVWNVKTRQTRQVTIIQNM